MKRKLEFKLGRKGYLQIDFIFAVAIFFIVFLFLHMTYLSFSENKTSSINALYAQDLSKVLCVQLTRSTGVPVNWEDNVSAITPQSMGLRSQNSTDLDLLKVLEFSDNSNFILFRDMMSSEFNVYIEFQNVSDNDSLISRFGSRSISEGLVYRSSCFSDIGTDSVKLQIEVWR